MWWLRVRGREVVGVVVLVVGWLGAERCSDVVLGCPRRSTRWCVLCVVVCLCAGIGAVVRS